MKILKIKPAPPGIGRGGKFKTLAFFDLEFSLDIRLYNLRLLGAEDGTHLVYGPRLNGAELATFSRPLRDAILELALEALEVNIHEHDKKAA